MYDSSINQHKCQLVKAVPIFEKRASSWWTGLGVYNKPVAIIVAASICHHNKHQRAGSCGVLEKNSFSCCLCQKGTGSR